MVSEPLDEAEEMELEIPAPAPVEVSPPPARRRPTLSTFRSQKPESNRPPTKAEINRTIERLDKIRSRWEKRKISSGLQER